MSCHGCPGQVMFLYTVGDGGTWLMGAHRWKEPQPLWEGDRIRWAQPQRWDKAGRVCMGRGGRNRNPGAGAKWNEPPPLGWGGWAVTGSDGSHHMVGTREGKHRAAGRRSGLPEPGVYGGGGLSAWHGRGPRAPPARRLEPGLGQCSAARGWRMLALRLCTVKKTTSVLVRALTSQSNGSKSLPDMSEGHLPIHVNNVRSRLRAIVGASTNWRDHVQAMQERKALHNLLAQKQEDLPPKKMKDSYIEVILPLGSQPEIREKYLNVHNSVRFGRILEDLDSLGVLICYTHTKHESHQRSPLSIVTALVDKINLCKKVIYPDCDIKFTGSVSWVGKTSMEVKMHMLQEYDGVYSPVLDATFVMVARDPENKRSAFVNPLIPDGPREEEVFKQGALNKIKRTDFSTASLLKMAPTAEERNIVHNMFLNTLDTRTVSFRSRVLPPNSVWMEDAKLKGLQICHPQERNIFNRIFGGFLMRKAFELGWATACNYGGSRPFIVSVDDIMFQRPVEIGSLLLLSAQVCYTEKNYIQIRVHSEVYDTDIKEHKTTNIFHFTFMSENEVPQIVPKTYGESMLYLDGKRHFSATMKETREAMNAPAAA